MMMMLIMFRQSNRWCYFDATNYWLSMHYLWPSIDLLWSQIYRLLVLFTTEMVKNHLYINFQFIVLFQNAFLNHGCCDTPLPNDHQTSLHGAPPLSLFWYAGPNGHKVRKETLKLIFVIYKITRPVVELSCLLFHISLTLLIKKIIKLYLLSI